MNIKKELIDTNFRGNVYIVQDNKVLCENVTGFYDLANEIPDSLDTKFASASAGKDYAHFQGCAPGVSFISKYNSNNGIMSVLVSNYGDNVWEK